ncbi:sugar ABC transporter ATP-binding protein [uncultured Clostridium sp.]|uniref:sugar ABC transporter ATP-binding protein n=1 Tax=uncultured Clostridium sp. TaxID=59620 RepID=UPI0025D117A7|nr:sugar ABC transporter ATP-binding protein [uncultured Clostridium sp.]
MAVPSLTVRNLTKTFPGVKALNDASIEFYPGEVHALLGENGAGKSTLCKILSGAYGADSGEIYIDGRQYQGFTPSEAKKAGIGIIYQEFNLVPALSVYENLFLGKEIRNGIMLKRSEMIRRTKEVFDRLKVSLDPVRPVGELSIAYQQLVEIGKAIYENAKILIMDEPTAPLTGQEVGVLFEIIRDLKRQGITIIYISHRIEELFELAEKVTVMCDGRVIRTLNTAETTRRELVSLMVGRELGESYPEKGDSCTGETALQVSHLTTGKLKDVSFEVRAGEILGFAGLVGAGRTEIARAVFGADVRTSGEISVHGRPVPIRTPSDAIRAGICLIPEDRKGQGIHLHLSVRNNISLTRVKSLSRFMMVQRGKEQKLIDQYIHALEIKTPSDAQLTDHLSGGNQQKVVLSKWLAANCNIMIFDEPTRGIDVGAKQEIYQLMANLRREGKAIIMISSELPELIGMSDRIMVMHEGRLSGFLSGSEVTQSAILELASGGSRENSLGVES